MTIGLSKNKNHIQVDFGKRIIWIPNINCPNFSTWVKEAGLHISDVRHLINFDPQ